MESKFSSLLGSPLAAQGMVQQPRAAWVWVSAGRAVGRSRKVNALLITCPGGSRTAAAASGTKRWGRGWGHTSWCLPIFRFISLPLSRHSGQVGKDCGDPHSDMGSLVGKPRAFPLGVWATRTKQGMNSLGQSPLGLPRDVGADGGAAGGPGSGSSPAGILGEWVSPRCSQKTRGRVFTAPLAICSCHWRRGAPTSQAADRSLCWEAGWRELPRRLHPLPTPALLSGA